MSETNLTSSFYGRTGVVQPGFEDKIVSTLDAVSPNKGTR